MTPQGNWKQVIAPFLLGAMAMAAGYWLHGREAALPLGVPARAQALGNEQVSMLSASNFFVTTNSEGNHVRLWFFERRGAKEDSRLYYVTQATEAGPSLK